MQAWHAIIIQRIIIYEGAILMNIQTSRIIFFLNENEKLTKEEQKFINELNQVLQNYNDLKERLFREENGLLDFEFIRDWFDYSLKSSCFQLEFMDNFQTTEPLFNINKIVPVNYAPKIIDMGLNDFQDFLKSNNISTLFTLTTSNSYFNLFLDENLESFSDFEEEQIAGRILKKYTTLYNNVLKKLDNNTLTQKTYFCVFDSFAFGYIQRGFNYSIDENHILSAIAIMCKDEINKEVELFRTLQAEREKEQKERLEKEHLAQERQTCGKISQLEDKILNDENFASCRSEKDRLRYLRTILQEESHDVIMYLEMELLSTGIVRAKGIKGKLFINRLWNKLNNNE